MRAATLGMLLATLQGPSSDTVLARVDAYLVAYEAQLSVLIADERLTQMDAQPLSTE